MKQVEHAIGEDDGFAGLLEALNESHRSGCREHLFSHASGFADYALVSFTFGENFQAWRGR
jgi:hypothetical protein